MMNFSIIKPDADCGCSGQKNISFNLVNPNSSSSGTSGPARWDQIIGRPSCMDSCETVLQHIKDNLGLGDLNNVSITSPANNHGLYYNSSSNTWENKSILSTLPLSATAPILYDSGTGVISSNVANTSQDGYLTSTDWNIFNNKQPAGNYITSLTGEATASGPGAASVTLSNSAVLAKVLTGLNITGGTVVATDSILQAFGKLQNQISALLGGVTWIGVWNSSTNTPALTSSVGTKGHYYIVDTDGSTNLDGITDWKVGDWAIFNGTTWDKVDNTDAVSSVNGYTAAVSLVTGDVLEGAGVLPGRPSNLYYTDARARAAISLTTTGTSGAATYNSITGVFNIPQYTPDLSGYVPYTGATGSVTLGAYDLSATNLVASTKVNIASPSGTTGDLNTGQGGVYSYRSAGRYVRFNTSGTFNDFLSLGAKLVMNYGFSGTVENISMFEGSAAGDGQFIVGSPTATNARFLLKGKDTGTTNFISRWFDSGNTEKFSVRNDGQTTVASLSSGGIVKSTAGVLGIAVAGTDYLTPGGVPTGISATSPIFYNPGTGVISSQAASASLEGYVTIGTQAFAGLKSFNTNIEVGTTGTAGNVSFRRSSDGAIASTLEQFDTNTLLLTSNGGTRKLTVDANNVDFNSSSSSAQYNFGQNRPTATEVLINGSNNNKLRIQNNETDVITLNSNGGVVTAVTGTFSGNVTAANLASGTYTPTLTNGTNVSSSLLNDDFHYIRVGNEVTVEGSVVINFSGAGNTVFDISLPITSNFTGQYQLNGSGINNAPSIAGSAICRADTTNDRMSMNFAALSANGLEYVIRFTYTIQ